MRPLVTGFIALGLLSDLPAQVLQRHGDLLTVVVLTDAVDLASSVAGLDDLKTVGFRAAVVAGEGCLVGRVDAGHLSTLRAHSGVSAVVSGPVGEAVIASVRPGQRTGLRYLNALLAGTFETPDVRAPMDWSAHPVEHALERPFGDGAPAHDHGSDRSWAPQAEDWTCGEAYNSETMEGVIVASTFFIESNGAIDADLYTWPQADIDNVKLQVIDAWAIWSYSASLYGRTVTAVMDWYEPSGGATVQGYEPVTRAGSSDQLWIDAILTNLGRTEYGAFSKLYGFNHDRRQQLGAARSFSAFVAYNPGSAPSQFTDGKIGYAYLGGPYTQILWRANGWNSSQINRVYGHEVGHIFHAFDEYSSSTTSNCARFFNGRQNSNYQGSTCNGTASCVMINNAFTGSGSTRRWQLCTHTPYHLGWQGTLAQPVATAPVNDSIVTVNPVVLRWNRSGAPVGTSGHVKVFDRNTDTLVYCGSMGSADTLAISLVNGEYRWTVSVGNSNTGNGYAGIIGTAALFQVNAPLNAAFTRSPMVLCAGSTVTYTNTSTGLPTVWNWAFPGGVPSTWSGKFPPPVLYSAPGTYPATLVVGDGLTTATVTIADAVNVAGGQSIPFVERFNAMPLLPISWTVQGGGTGQGGGGLTWTQQVEPACVNTAAAVVPAFGHTGFYASPVLRSPRIDLTTGSMPYLRFKHSYARRGSSPGGRLSITANNCNFTRYAELFSAADSLLATNGGAPQPSPAWVPSTCAHWRTTVVRLDSLRGHIAEISFRFNVPGPDQDLHLDDVEVFEGVRPRVRALLEGPFDGQTGLMRDGLRTQAILPLSEPFTALGFPWSGEGGGQVTPASVLAVTGPDAIVDWVVLEVRDSADATKVLASRAALLQRDGDIVEVDGLNGPRMPVPQGHYHIAVHHRNHLSACTAMPVAVGPNAPVVDFGQSATPTYGTDARRMQGAYALLWAGDATRNNLLSYTGAGNDRDAVLARIGGVVPTSTTAGYFLEDTNLDGVVKYTGLQNDRDPILLNIGGVVPTNTRLGQLP